MLPYDGANPLLAGSLIFGQSRTTALAPSDLIDATELLFARLKPERLASTVSRPLPQLSDRSLRDDAAAGDNARVLASVREMFAFEDVTG